jgi:multiple sugar transport system ATP-binding protein
MAEVVLDHVTKVFPSGVTAVRDLSLTVRDGEFVTFVGPSGCGKTTTLRLIAGLEEPTAGAIRLGGRVANRLPPRERDVALVFQRHSLYPYLNIRGNLAFGLRLRHSAGWLARLVYRLLRPARYAEVLKWEEVIAERVAQAAHLLDLADALERLPAELSGGQQQRAALGRALVRQPAVFLLDEPLSHLDARLRAEMRRQLHLLHRRLQATMIYVTHDQIEAMTLGERLVVLDHGILRQAGPPTLVYRHPRNRFVAEFLGWPPMNFLDGQLAKEDERLYFVGGPLKFLVPADQQVDLGCAVGSSVTLGIRPEHVSWAVAGGGGAIVAAEVIVIEPLGSDCLATFQNREWRFTAKMDGRCVPAVGQTVEVAMDMQQAHWFDQASGLALRGSDPGG